MSAPFATASIGRYLALGDSYTIGEGVPADGTWPFMLAAGLRQQGVMIDDPLVIATTGWTTDELMAGIDAVDPKGPFALVSLLIGVNNQYRGRGLAEYRQQFEQLLQRAIELAGNNSQHVLVLSTPDWGATPYARENGRDAAVITYEINEFNATARASCGDYNVPFVDITDISRDGTALPTMLVEDGLHPSAAMYARWCARALPVALAQLS